LIIIWVLILYIGNITDNIIDDIDTVCNLLGIRMKKFSLKLTKFQLNFSRIIEIASKVMEAFVN